MRVLDVVDRVLRVLLAGQLEVEVDRRLVRAREHEPADGVDSDRLDQLVERHEVAAALGHLRLLAALDDVDELQDRDLEPVGLVAERGHHALHAADVAVVVGAEDVDQAVEAAPDLVLVIGDVGGEVRRGAGRAHEHAVLVVAVLARAHPQRALGLVAVTELLEDLECDRDRGRVAFVQRALEEVGVEVDAVGVQRRADALHDQRRRLAAELLRARLGGVRDAGRELGDVVALIAVLGQRFIARAGAHGGAELRDLRAGVVEVVLAHDLVAGQFEQPRQRVAVGRVAAARRGQRAGRVGRDELDVDPLALLGRAATPIVAGGHDLARGGDVPGVGQEDVEEPRAGDLDVVERGPEALGQALPEPFGDLARRGAQRGRQQHRRVGGVVAEAGLLRALEAGARLRGRVAVAQVRSGCLDGRPQLVDGVHGQ